MKGIPQHSMLSQNFPLPLLGHVISIQPPPPHISNHFLLPTLFNTPPPPDWDWAHDDDDPDDALIYGALHMKGLVYTQYVKCVYSFFPPWMSWPQYLDQNNR